MKILNWISDHLLYLVFAVGAFSLFVPQFGSGLGWIVTPILAIMVLNVSMTIKIEDLKQIKQYPILILWGTFLQFVPMSLFSLILGKIFIPSPDIRIGQILLGSLPADIAAPLMVYLIGGNTALATAMLVVAMALTPFILPNVLTLLGGVPLQVPTSYLIVELVVIIIIPVVLGIFFNYHSKRIREKEKAWSGVASLCYLILLFIVVSSNAKVIISLKQFSFLIIIIELILNLFGYALAYLTKHIFKSKDIALPLLFLVGSKEFGIAAAAVDTMKLNSIIIIPSVFYAVVQMISLPIMVKIINKRLSKNSLVNFNT